MSTNQAHNEVENPASGYTNGGSAPNIDKLTQHMTHEEKKRAVQAGRFGYGPLAHIHTTDTSLLPGM